MNKVLSELPIWVPDGRKAPANHRLQAPVRQRAGSRLRAAEQVNRAKTIRGWVTMPLPDRNKIASEWASRGFSCDLWTDPPGQRWEDFRHATDELVTVLEGQMEFEITGQVHHPQIGEELLIPAGADHSARNIGKTTARWLYGYKRE